MGCIAYIHIPKEHRKKLDARAKRVVFVGYAEDYKGWKFVDPKEPGKILKSRDAVFQEFSPAGLRFARMADMDLHPEEPDVIEIPVVFESPAP